MNTTKQLTPAQYKAWQRYQAALKAYRDAQYDKALGEGRH